MLIKLSPALKQALIARGVECFLIPGVHISGDGVFEPPCSMKWMGTFNEVSLGAFSYAVSGYFQDVSIGRYTSIGEAVQIGRAAHSMDWVSTSPFFSLHERMFAIGSEFDVAAAYHEFRPRPPPPGIAATHTRPISIGNDVWIGHGAFVMPGVTVGDGAVIGAGAVVTKDVPPYAMVSGSPATIRKMRLPLPIAAALLELQWWRFAPWDLKEVDFWDPGRSADQLRKLLPSLKPYVTTAIAVGEIANEIEATAAGSEL
jgi:acetyltransferase-like isoleucine patch superfamily enzyme